MKKKYRIKIEETQNGKTLDVRTVIIESSTAPRVGQSTAKLVDPPICETVIEVEEI